MKPCVYLDLKRKRKPDRKYTMRYPQHALKWRLTTLQCSFATGPAARTSAACKALEASDPEMGAPFPDVEDLERRQLTRKWVPSMRPGAVDPH